MSHVDRRTQTKAPTCCHKHHSKWEKRRWHRLVRRAAKLMMQRRDV